MIGNLSATKPSSYLIANYQRNVGAERPGIQSNEANQKNPDRRLQRALLDVSSSEKPQKEFGQSRDRKFAYNETFSENMRELFKGRTTLYKMMETMGATGTEGSVTGLYLDTYI